MISLYYSQGKIFHLSDHSEEYKLCFYEYDYKFSTQKIDDMVKTGLFGFVNFQNGKPVSIQLSPQYNAVIDKKNIIYVEINELIIGDTEFEYVKTVIKISGQKPEFGPTDLNKYSEKCHKYISERK